MLSASITLFFACVITMLPVMFWMYVYTSFSSFELSRRYFLGGIVIGALSAGIFIFHESLWVAYFFQEIFYRLTLARESFLGLNLGFSLSKFFLFFVFLAAMVGIFWMKTKQEKQSYVKKILSCLLSFLALILLFSLVIYGMNYLPEIQKIGAIATFWDYSFIFLGTIIWYYIVISLLEEGMKYFWVLVWTGSSASVKNLPHFLLISVSIALGFSLFETAFYGYQYYSSWNAWAWLIKLLFLRSIFVSSVHIFCSLLMSLWFWYIVTSQTLNFAILRLFFVYAWFSLISHTFFDVSLTYGYIAVIFLYVFFLYLFMSYFLAQDRWPAHNSSL